MKKYTSVLIGILLIIVTTGYALAAPTIDGDLTDWGLSSLKSDDWQYNETWLPDPIESSIANDIQFIIEDNKDPQWGEIDGVHIRGITTNYVRFFEPKVLHTTLGWIPEPVGGEPFDIEASYLYQDSTDVYIAIVTSVDPSGTGGIRPGDIAFNIDNDLTTGEYGYEFGLIVSSSAPYPQGSIVYYPNWEGIGAVIPENPDVVITPDFPETDVKGYAEIIYTNTWLDVIDYTKPNYVIEIRIPKSDIGLTGNLQMSQMRYADNCLNDHIFIPEFPIFATLIGIVFGLAGMIYMVKSKYDE